MNKHTLAQTLKSIAHYKEQNAQLKEAIKINESTIADLEESLKEYFPFYIDDVILINGEVCKVGKLTRAYLGENGEAIFRFEIQNPYGREWRKGYEKYLSLTELEKVKIIESQK